MRPRHRLILAAGLLLGLTAIPAPAVVTVKHRVITGDDKDGDGRFDPPFSPRWAPFPGKTKQTAENFEIQAPDGLTLLAYEFCEDPEFAKPPRAGRAPNLAGVGWYGPMGASGFYGKGFFDLLLDGEGLGGHKAETELLAQGEAARIRFTWRVPSGKDPGRAVRALFEYPGDLTACFLATFEISGTPPPNEWQLELLMYPAGFPWQEKITGYEIHGITSTRDEIWDGRKPLSVPVEDRWLLLAETKMTEADRVRAGALSCAIIWSPAEVDEITLDKNSRAFLRFKAGVTRAHLVLREFPLMSPAQCVAFMKKTSITNR